MEDSKLEMARASSLEQLKKLFRTSSTFTVLYTFALTRLKPKACQRAKMRTDEAARSVVSQAHQATKNKIKNAKSTGEIPTDLIKFLKSAVGEKCKFIGRPDLNNQKVWHLSGEFQPDIHGGVTTSIPFPDEYKDTAFRYLSTELRLKGESVAILKAMIYDTFDKKELATKLNLREKEVQTKKDYLLKRLKTLRRENRLLPKSEDAS
jgi:hypothetical protein